MSDTTPDAVDPTAGWNFETKQIHAGQPADGDTNARALPIYQTTSYTFDNTDHAAALFGLAEPGNIYTRIMNPTQDVVEQRIAALEGGVAALLLASGQAAETLRDPQHRRGRRPHRRRARACTAAPTTCSTTRCPSSASRSPSSRTPTTSESWRAAVRPNTKAFFAETISNPKIDVLDIPGVAEVAHENGVPLIVDNTIATPYLIRPLEHGADIVVHSATKYLGGHGTAIAGVIVDGGTFDWTQRPLPRLHHPRPELPRRRATPTSARPRYALKARVQLLRDLGSAVVAVQRVPHRPGHSRR